VATVTEPAEPFLGPRPYGRSEEDRARFFGRDREAAELRSLIVSHPIVLVYAQSGAGKTSLFEAEIAHSLARKRVEVLPLARVRCSMPDGIEPASLDNLYAFATLLSVAPAEAPQSLVDTSLQVFLRRQAGRARCLVFDQFEELFTDESVFRLHPNDWEEQQRRFFRQVADAVAADPLLRIVFVIRKEYIAELDRFAPLLPERLQTTFHLEPLARDGALAAVTCPVENTWRSFADGVAEELVEKLLRIRVHLGGETTDARGRFVEPLHLQLVCKSLWDDLGQHATVITKDDLHAHADVDEVLGEFYDEAVRTSAEAVRLREQDLRRRIEREFITPAGTRGQVFGGVDGAGFDKALRELERHQLIRADWKAGARWYELTHDRLIGPVKASNERHAAKRANRRKSWLGFAILASAIAVGLAAWLGGEREGTVFPRAPLAALSTRDAVYNAEFSPDGELVLTAGADGAARVWEWASEPPRPRVLWSAGSRALTRAAFSPDGTRVVTAGADGVARILDRESGAELVVLRPPGSAPLSGAAFDRSGTLVATAGSDGVARLWDVESGRHLAVLEPRNPLPLTTAAFSPDGRLVVTGGVDGFVRVWSRRGAEMTRVRLAAQVTSAAFSPDGKLVVATTAGNGTARVWSPTGSGPPAAIGLRGGAPLASAAFSPDGRWIVTAGTDGVARGWDVRSPLRPLAILDPPGSAALVSAAFSRDGRLVVTADAVGTTRIYGQP